MPGGRQPAWLLPVMDLIMTRPWGRAVHLLHRGAFMPAHIHAYQQY